MSDTLSFVELKVGERFIAVPQQGDDSGHVGLKDPHYIFMKISSVGRENAIREKDHVLSGMPESMPVIKVE